MAGIGGRDPELGGRRAGGTAVIIGVSGVAGAAMHHAPLLLGTARA